MRETTTPTRRRRGLKRRLVAIAAALLTVAGIVAAPSAAMAYTTTGCKWGSASLTIDQRYVNGNFRTALTSARSNYNSATDVTLSATDSVGPSFTAANSNYGANGWEGYATWTCFFGTTTAASISVNQYYLFGTEPINRLKMVWLHELGHGLGLDHVTVNTRVMYTSASTAYFNGTTALTSDEINGINALY